MKTKIILIATVAVVVVGGAMLFAPRHLLAQTNRVNSTGPKILYYTCPMHPSVKSAKPGNCPECGMTLQPVYGAAKGTNPQPAATSTNASRVMMPGCCSPGGGCR
jgi:hypothetical protein